MESDTLKDTLRRLYKELNYPSTEVFYKALKRRGIPARKRDVEEFVQSRAERQILAPPPKFKGHVVSEDLNARWAADLISFVSRPATFKGREYRYILLVQDIFSRLIYARPLSRVDQTTTAFEEILDEAGTTPLRVTFDTGPEFGKTWKAMLARRGIEPDIKEPADKQAIATLDRAIATLKRALTRRVAAGGDNWASELENAVKGMNSSSHSALDGEEPKDVATNEDLQFSLKKAAAAAENGELIEARQKALEKAGAYRVHEPPAGGLKARADKPIWSEEIHYVKDFPSPGVVRDTEDRTTLTKLTRPVPSDSSEVVELPRYATRGSAQVDTARKRALAPYADRLKTIAREGSTLSAAAAAMKRGVAGFREELKRQKASFRQFVELFPDVAKISQGRLSIVGERRGPLDAYAE
jgi:hypothetical protein